MRDVDARFDEITRPNHGYQFQFHWRRPKLHAYRAARRRRLAFVLNRYPGAVIGAAFQVGHKVVSLVWGKPGRLKPGSCVDCAKGVRHLDYRATADTTEGVDHE